MYVKNVTDGPLLDVPGDDFAEVDVRDEPYATFRRNGWLVEASPVPDAESPDAGDASDEEQSSQAPRKRRAASKSHDSTEGN